jgi:hypothetical protein
VSPRSTPIAAIVLSAAGLSCVSNPTSPPDTGPVDAGPTISPLCQPCNFSQDCNRGAPSPNLCIADPMSGGHFCGTACTTAADCPALYSCMSVKDVTGQTSGMNCLPASTGSCANPTGAVDAGMNSGTGALCRPCTSSRDCNDPGFAGNFCLTDPAGGGACGTECMSPTDCPSGTTCNSVMDPSGTMLAGNCFPTSGSCQAGFDGGTSSSILCMRCMQESDCNPGGTTANHCLMDPSGVMACGTDCHGMTDCPQGFSCYSVRDQTGQVVGGNCFPANQGSCFATDAG